MSATAFNLSSRSLAMARREALWERSSFAERSSSLFAASCLSRLATDE
jgi:hypothetical protein